MKPIKLTPQQLDTALGLEPMLTLADIKEQATELRNLLHKAQTTKISDPPSVEELDSYLADIEDACNDDCDTCLETEKANGRLFKAIHAATKGKPNPEEMRAALTAVFFLGGMTAGESMEAVGHIVATLAPKVRGHRDGFGEQGPYNEDDVRDVAGKPIKEPR